MSIYLAGLLEVTKKQQVIIWFSLLSKHANSYCSVLLVMKKYTVLIILVS